mgnify:CR=1 FL=1
MHRGVIPSLHSDDGADSFEARRRGNLMLLEFLETLEAEATSRKSICVNTDMASDAFPSVLTSKEVEYDSY